MLVNRWQQYHKTYLEIKEKIKKSFSGYIIGHGDFRILGPRRWYIGWAKQVFNDKKESHFVNFQKQSRDLVFFLPFKKSFFFLRPENGKWRRDAIVCNKSSSHHVGATNPRPWAFLFLVLSSSFFCSGDFWSFDLLLPLLLYPISDSKIHGRFWALIALLVS